MPVRPTGMRLVGLAALVLPGVALAKGIQYDLVLEKAFTYHIQHVGIDYDTQAGPLFTIVGSEAVEVIDTSGTITPVGPRLARHDWAECSPKGRYVGIMRMFTEMDIRLGRPSVKYRFILRDRGGNVLYEFPIAYFDRIWISDDGRVAAARTVSFSVYGNWRVYDPTGGLRGEITTPAENISFFGDSGSFFTRPGPIAAYDADLNQLWSFNPVSPSLRDDALQISSDGQHIVRSSKQGLQFYKDGILVELDTTLAGPRAQYYWVFITPDDSHVLVSAEEQARLYDLSNYQVVRTYNPVAPRIFGCGSASANGDYVLLSVFPRGDTTMVQSVALFDQAGDVVWEVEGRFEQRGTPWVSIDAHGRYIVLWDRHHLWLYERR